MTLGVKFILRALLALFVVIALDAFLELELTHRARNDQRVGVSLELGTLRARIEKEIVENLSIIHGTAHFVSVTPNLSQELFERFAEGVLKQDNLLRNISAARGFVITYVYPLIGNKAILGIDYRTLPKQWEQVKKARDTGKMVIAGPLPLVQGGSGLIGRAPIFANEDGTKKFWGMISAVIDADHLFAKVGIRELNELDIAIRGVDGKGADGKLIGGNEALFDPKSNAVFMPVTFPSGSWLIAARPVNGWVDSHPFADALHVLFGAFSLLFLFTMYKGMKRHHEIVKTRESLNQAQALAHLGSWELDSVGNSLWWSDEAYRIFGVDRESFSPTLEAFFSLVHQDDRKMVLEQYQASLSNRKPYRMEHRIVRPDGMIRHVLEHGENDFDHSGQVMKSKGTVLDITDRKIMEERLANEEKKFRAMAEASYDAFIMVDAKGIVLFWSPAAERMFGWTADEIMGRDMHKLITPERYHEDAARGMAHFAKTGTGPVLESVMEFEAIRKDGSLFPAERSVSAFQIGDEFFAVGILRDITERKKVEKELERLATKDGLTGLSNRRHFVTLAEREMERSKRYGRSLSLIMFDADRFKLVNDTYGHDVGDDVLREIASTVVSELREVDIVGRLGGEEFGVVLPETDLPAAKLVAERLRQSIENRSVGLKQGGDVKFTVSLGVAVYNDVVASFADLLKLADTALYKAKHSGRNRSETVQQLEEA